MINLTTNLTLMALTAGRIWWIRRHVVTILEPSVTRTYDTVIAMILESGAIYCITIIVYLLVKARLNRPDSLPAISVFEASHTANYEHRPNIDPCSSRLWV
ncbi:hypothetical protein B0H14DRAFT_1158411 [Mycena olivaceomarginata]|nr:hypothetical protein B0H14DRAFT_1158411 [Mycena olivaceomarginata]